MKLDWSNAGLLALCIGLAAVITGGAEGSMGWTTLGLLFLFIWLASLILAMIPRSLHKRLVRWLEDPGHAVLRARSELDLEAIDEIQSRSVEDTKSATHVNMMLTDDAADEGQPQFSSTGDTLSAGSSQRQRVQELLTNY